MDETAQLRLLACLFVVFCLVGLVAFVVSILFQYATISIALTLEVTN